MSINHFPYLPLVTNPKQSVYPDCDLDRHHRTTSSGYIFATKERIDNCQKNLLSSNISSTCPHNMVNFCPLVAAIGTAVWGTPADFNSFCVLASLLQRRRSTEANQTLPDVWLLPGLVDNIYIFGSCCPVTEFCHAKIHLKSSKS